MSRDSDDARANGSRDPMAPGLPHWRASEHSQIFAHTSFHHDFLQPAAFWSAQGEREATIYRTPDLADSATTHEELRQWTTEPPFPIVDWPRYTPIRFLGEGGMGRVFLARDCALERDVAIKFVHANNHRHADRLLQEARAQARVDHERVCKVFDAGTIQGEVYIAMQFIDGLPLSTIAAQLTLEEKVLMIREAARGIHEAHRVGIIHRDVKPSNILVERDDDGQVRPFVVDFGLARDWHASAALSGAIAGTPHYMAPEQLHVESARLDRRADVYSLGASLYVLLTGRPAIPGSSGLEVLSNLMTVEPRAPRAINANVPKDLEAITLKCLEKEPADRYESARALADDLDRFLNGEPVRVVHSSLLYRWRKRLAKHRVLATSAAAALVLIGASAGWNLHIHLLAGEQAALAEHYTEVVARIEAKQRYVALSPLHDLRPDHAALLRDLAELEYEVQEAEVLGRGAGSYALGRGWLAVGSLQKAQDALERAWQLDYREPKVAYCLALVLSQRYQKALVETLRIRDVEQREAAQRVVVGQFRDPALNYLKQSQGADVPSLPYVAALIAHYEGRFEQAHEHLDQIGDELTWFYEAQQARGDLLLAQAIKLGQHGQRQQAQVALDAGRLAYQRAVAIGESVPALHGALGELELAALTLELYGSGDVEPIFTRGLAASARALVAAPNYVPALLLQARLNAALAEHRRNIGEAIDSAVNHGLDAAHRALAQAPGLATAHVELLRLYRLRAEAWSRRGEDPAPALQQALTIAEQVPADVRDDTYYAGLGLVFKVWADHHDQSGQASEDQRQRAAQAFAQATSHNPRAINAWINWGGSNLAHAQSMGDQRSVPVLQAARSALDRALDLDPQHAAALFYSGVVDRHLAELALERGEAPDAELERALTTLELGHTISPHLPQIRNAIGSVRLVQAKAAWQRGEAPGHYFMHARASFDNVAALYPQDVHARRNLSLVWYWQAYFDHESGAMPNVNLDDALSAGRAALQLAPGTRDLYLDLATTYVLLARMQSDAGIDPTSALAAAQEELAQALHLAEHEALSLAVQGDVELIFAQWAQQRAGDAGLHLALAYEAYFKSHRLAPSAESNYKLAAVALAHIRWLAQHHKPWEKACDDGLAFATAAMNGRRHWALAELLYAQLLLVRADLQTQAELRRVDVDEARAYLQAAALHNPNLEQKCRQFAALAHGLVGNKMVVGINRR